MQVQEPLEASLINTAVHYDHSCIRTGLASFKSKSFVNVNNNTKNVQVEQYHDFKSHGLFHGICE